MNQAAWAKATASRLLSEELPERWAHTQGVAARSRFLAPILGKDADLVEASAWLHDIGYAPELAATGFHPLDGARYLRDVGQAGRLVCQLVAHHSCAVVEAEERGLREVLEAEFPPPPAELLEALTFADMTTGPTGVPMTVETRLAEILSRYGDDHIVTRSVTRAGPALVEAAKHVVARQTHVREPAE